MQISIINQDIAYRKFFKEWHNSNAFQLIKFLPQEIRHVVRMPARHQLNLDEFSYLSRKASHITTQDFVSDSTRGFAEKIRPEITKENPYLNLFTPALDTWKKIRADINKGFAGAIDLACKKECPEELQYGEFLRQHKVVYFFLLYAQMIKGMNKTNEIIKPDKLNEAGAIVTREARALAILPQNELALSEPNITNLYKEVGVDWERIKRLIFVIRDIKKAHWNNEKTADAVRFLRKQHTLNGELWSKIEAEKKSFFSQEALERHC